MSKRHNAEQLTLPFGKDYCKNCGEKLDLVDQLTQKQWGGFCHLCFYFETARRCANYRGISLKDAIFKYLKGVCRRTNYFLPAIWKGKTFIDESKKAK